MAAIAALTTAWSGIGAAPAGALGPGAQRIGDVAGVAGSPSDPAVALTFDDGPDPVTTPQILDILASRGAKATFFVLGSQAIRYPDLIRRIAREGHVVAGHTWGHARLTSMSEATFAREVDSTNTVIESLTGAPVRCVRPPQGLSDKTVVARLAARGLTTMQWSIDPQDWRTPGVGAIVQSVLGSLHPEAVVVLHDRRGASQTPVALPVILDGLHERGYRTATICGDGRSGPVRPEVVAYGAALPVDTGDLVSRSPLVGLAGTSPAGLRLAAGDGGVFALGEAPYAGRAPEGLRQPVVGMASTPSGLGYWLVGGDGGVFAFGDAGFFGSASVQKVVGIAPTATGLGYWLVGGDGGVFAFGDAPFLGSAAGVPLPANIVSITATATGWGYWLLAGDGQVFAFGDAPFLGSAAGVPGRRAVGLTRAPGGAGYWVVTERPA